MYDFGYKASDYISLGDYSNIKVEQTPSEEVTDDEIQVQDFGSDEKKGNMD